jgi:hypothetical protein
MNCRGGVYRAKASNTATNLFTTFQDDWPAGYPACGAFWPHIGGTLLVHIAGTLWPQLPGTFTGAT